LCEKDGIKMTDDLEERKANQAGAYQMWHPSRDEKQEHIKERNRARVARELRKDKELTQKKTKTACADRSIDELYKILNACRTSVEHS